MTQDVLDELQTDIADEKKLTELEEHEAAADMEYKQMLEELTKMIRRAKMRRASQK